MTTDEPPSKPNRNRLPAVDSEDVTRNPSDVNDQFDETDGVLSADVDSDFDEPVYPFDEPKDFDNTVVPFQNPKIVTCFGRSHSLQKKVDELLFMIHYHNKEKVEEIMEEGQCQKG